MKCELCKTEVKLTRKNLIKKIVTPIGTKMKIKGEDIIDLRHPLFGGTVEIYNDIKYTLCAKRDIIDLYFVCPVCDTETYVKRNSTPYSFNKRFILFEKDDWEIINKDKTRNERPYASIKR